MQCNVAQVHLTSGSWDVTTDDEEDVVDSSVYLTDDEDMSLIMTDDEEPTVSTSTHASSYRHRQEDGSRPT